MNTTSAQDTLSQSEAFFNFITSQVEKGSLLRNIVYSILIIGALVFLRSMIIHFVMRRTEEIKVRYFWTKTLSYISIFIGFIAIIQIWFTGFQSLGTFLGVFSAGVAIAMKDVIQNFAGWLFILTVHPLDNGDRIQIGEYTGDVIDISMFHISLMEIGNWVDADQSTGRVIRIPNGLVFTEALANYSQGFKYIWNEIPVLITFESNWRKAKELLAEIAKNRGEHLTAEAERRVKDASRHFLIYYSKLTPIVYATVRESGVLLTIRYLCEPRRRRGTEEAIWEDILEAFEYHEDIAFAYPTIRYFDNRTEGE